MAISLTKITKKLNLDLNGIKDKKKVKKEIGEYIIDEILHSVSKGKSPVSNRGAFKKLNKDYAKAEKNGDTNPDLELVGNMLDNLVSKNTKTGIEIGIFNRKEVGKADGHNNFSGKSDLPTRRFIPMENESFKRDIQKGIKEIVKEFKDKDEKKAKKKRIASVSSAIGTAESLAIADLFSDDSLEQFLEDNGYI